MSLYCTKHHSSKSNGSWAVSIKQNMNFDFQPPSSSYRSFFYKSDVESCSSCKYLLEYKSLWLVLLTNKQKLIVSLWPVQVLSLSDDGSYGIKNARLRGHL
jgi:hypothetical protein